MTAQPARFERSGPETASVMDVPPFKPPLVKAVFRDVTRMHVSRSAARAAASVTRTVLTEIIDGARRAAAEESRKRLVPGDLLSAIDRNVELEVGSQWYNHSPTFQGLTGVVHDAEGVKRGPVRHRGERGEARRATARRFPRRSRSACGRA
jgi:histone H3/H4